MLLLNERIPARQALDWGLVSEVVPSVRHGTKFLDEPTPEEVSLAQHGQKDYRIDLAPLDAAVDHLSRRLLGMFPECLRYTKQQVNFWKELSWHSTVGHGREWLALHFANREPHEGMNAFVEKRAPDVAGLRRRLAEGKGGEFLFGRPNRQCSSCGAQGLPEDFAFCGRCGAPIPVPTGPEG